MPRMIQVAKFHGWETLINRPARVFPYWSCALRHRINQKRATNVVVTGEPGSGKSYMATDIARVSEGLTAGGKDRFKLDQVVFRYADFMNATINLDMGKIVVFDEPSYAMGKRDWFKEVNKALVRTIESARFKVHPLFIPIINKALLDKTIRSFLIQFQIEIRDRGRAVVYKIDPSQHSDKVYRYTFCHLEYRMLDWDQCNRDSCLDCSRLIPADPKAACQLFRARYERKKAAIQDARYEQDFEQASKKETQVMTNQQIAVELLKYRSEFLNPEGGIDAHLLRVVAAEKLKLQIGHSRSYTLKKMLEYKWPDLFPK